MLSIVESRRADVIPQHQPLAHAISRTSKRLSFRHQVESLSPFNVGRDRRMDIIAVEGGGSQTP